MNADTVVKGQAKPWVLAADHARARLFIAETPTAPLAEIEDLVNSSARLHDGERTADKPGRLVGGSSAQGGHHSHGHVAGGRETPKQRDADLFAKQVCDRLAQECSAGAMSKLYVIAEPDFLGMLRKHLSPQVRKHVVLEMDKDLTRNNAADIRGALPKQL